MKREDFLFVIGYQGKTALVDKMRSRAYGRLDTRGLVEKGMFRPALCSALLSGDKEEQVKVVEGINQKSLRQYRDFDELKKVFGVYRIPESISSITYL